MILHPHLVEEDMEVASDIRTAKEVAKMGSSISDMISLTWDCPSNNDNNRMALLNTEVWVEDNKVWYEHYRKPMANPLLVPVHPLHLQTALLHHPGDNSSARLCLQSGIQRLNIS